MKLSNFKRTEKAGSGFNEIYFADVDVTTGFWFWKKTERKKIFRGVGEPWRWCDNGAPVVAEGIFGVFKIHDLERAYDAANTH